MSKPGESLPEPEPPYLSLTPISSRLDATFSTPRLRRFSPHFFTAFSHPIMSMAANLARQIVCPTLSMPRRRVVQATSNPGLGYPGLG